ncbi:hypothetical protein [Mycobacterium sp. 050134]|uniref:hypothetical protein n=1 Tax=Mycobacterium sp. 050134 TaxID=3096111 RepID=UPI002EDAD55C
MPSPGAITHSVKRYLELVDKATLHDATVIDYPDNNTIFDQVIAGTADAKITEIRWRTAKHPVLCGVDVDQPRTFEQKAYLIRHAGTTTQQ